MTYPISTSLPISIPPRPIPLPQAMERLYDVTSRVLGTGGNGCVNEGTDLNSHSPVAIKTQRRVRGVELEARILQHLEAPHGVRYRDTFNGNKQNYIVMDLIPEKNIVDAFIFQKNSEERLTLDEIVCITKQLLEFLDGLSNQKIIFFDLKLTNMIYRRPARALTVIDFGSARYSDLVEDSYREATPVISAPEYILGGKVTSTHDYWSLACALFTLVTGRQLFLFPGTLLEVGPVNHLIQQIVQQIGNPTPEFLQSCKKASQFFNQKMEFCNDLSLPPRMSWQEEIRRAFQWNGWAAQEGEEFIALLGKLLCYENRATPKSLIASRLFEREIEIHLIVDRHQKCNMYLHRLSDITEHLLFVTLADIARPDLTLDFSQSLVECLHLPRDPDDQYLLILEKDGIIVKEALSLHPGESLDIREYQHQLAIDVLQQEEFLAANEKGLFSVDENVFPSVLGEQKLSQFSFEDWLNGEKENVFSFGLEDQGLSPFSLDHSFGNEKGNILSSSFGDEPPFKKQRKD